MISSQILCLPLVLPAADSIEDLYARFGGGVSKTATNDFQSAENLEEGLLKQILLTYDPSVDFEGHSFHFALGEKLTDQLSFEWEVQSLDMDLDSFNPQTSGFTWPDGPNDGLFYSFVDPDNPQAPDSQLFQLNGATGTFSALALTANIHFEYQFEGTGFGLYGGVGAGFSKNEIELTVVETGYFGPDVEGDVDKDGNDIGDGFPDNGGTKVSEGGRVELVSGEEWDFCWHWRAGIEFEVDRKSTFYVGWRAADYGKPDILGTGPSLTADTIEFGFQQSF
jgi:opacity protein-like surface antigen